MKEVEEENRQQKEQEKAAAIQATEEESNMVPDDVVAFMDEFGKNPELTFVDPLVTEKSTNLAAGMDDTDKEHASAASELAASEHDEIIHPEQEQHLDQEPTTSEIQHHHQETQEIFKTPKQGRKKKKKPPPPPKRPRKKRQCKPKKPLLQNAVDVNNIMQMNNTFDTMETASHNLSE